MKKDLISISIKLEPETVEFIDKIVVPRRMPRSAWLYLAVKDRLKKDENTEGDELLKT